MQTWKLFAGYTFFLHVVLIVCYAWCSTWLLESEDKLQKCEGDRKHMLESAHVPPCEPFTYFCRDDPITSETNKGKFSAWACKNESLMGELSKYISQEPLGWRRVDDAIQAAFVMDDGISFLISGHGHAGGCAHSANVRTQIVGAFHHAPEICQKFGLLKALRVKYAKLSSTLAANGLSGEVKNEGHMLEAMFDHWSFVPRTYEMGDMTQRSLLFDRVPCEGPNTEWLIKQDQHGGRGIIEIESYEELRRKFLEPDDDQCIQEMLRVGGGGNESDDLSTRIASMQVAFRGGRRQRFRASLDQGRDIVQQIVRPLLWDGERFVARAFFIALRAGRVWQRPMRPSGGQGIDELWDIGRGRYDLWMFDIPYFMRHPGLVSDHSHKEVETLNASALDGYVDSQRGKANFVADVFMPTVESIASLCWEASEKPNDSGDTRNIIEPDGSYQVFAGDFIVSESLGVALLEFSSGMAFDHLREGPAGYLLPIMSSELAHLMFSEFGLSPRSTASEDKQEKLPFSHWRKIGERPLVPHP